MTEDDKCFLGTSGAGCYPKPRCGSKDFCRLQMTGCDGAQKDTECWEYSRCTTVFKDWRSFTKYPGGRVE